MFESTIGGEHVLSTQESCDGASRGSAQRRGLDDDKGVVLLAVSVRPEQVTHLFAVAGGSTHRAHCWSRRREHDWPSVGDD